MRRLFELMQERPVHWHGGAHWRGVGTHRCQFHAKELNVRELFQLLNRKTTGPKSFSRPLGKPTGDAVRRQPVTKCRPVPGPAPELPEARGAPIEWPDGNSAEVRAPAGSLCSGYRALRAAISHLIQNTADEYDTVIVSTDSQAALASLRRGPAEQRTALCAEVWEALLSLATGGRRIQLPAMGDVAVITLLSFACSDARISACSVLAHFNACM